MRGGAVAPPPSARCNEESYPALFIRILSFAPKILKQIVKVSEKRKVTGAGAPATFVQATPAENRGGSAKALPLQALFRQRAAGR
jgi:hypothetical protein